MKKPRLLRTTLSIWLLAALTAFSAFPAAGVGASPQAADAGAPTVVKTAATSAAAPARPSEPAPSSLPAQAADEASWTLLAEKTYDYIEAEFIDFVEEDEAAHDAEPSDEEAPALGETAASDYAPGGNPYGATKYEPPQAAGRLARAATDTLAIDSVEVVYGGEVQAKYRPDLVTLGEDGKYYTAKRDASITDPRVFHVSAAFDNADGKGAPYFDGSLTGPALEAAYAAFLEKLQWTYGGKPLSDWKRASGSSWNSALTGPQFITVVGSRLLKSEGGYRLEADVRFDTRLNALAGANNVQGNVPYVGYAISTQGNNSFRPQELNDIVGSYALTVKYADPADEAADKEIGARPVRLTLYDSYLTWKEADAWARDLKARAEAADGAIGRNGRYVSVQSLTKTLEGNDLWNVVIADSKASVEEYLNVTRPLMESSPAALKAQIPGGNQKIPLYFSVTHSDEVPGPDANVRAAEIFLNGDELSFDSFDELTNHPYTVNPSTGARQTVGYFERQGESVTHHSFKIDDALDKFIIVINITSNPDGRDHLLRGNYLGIEQNRQASGHVTVESAAVAADVFKWSPLIDNELHGYVANMLLMPGSGPHAPYYEHDLVYPDGLRQADAMGRAILGSTPLKRFLVPFYHYQSGWDDGATIYAHNYSVLFGGIGQNIEIPYANEDAVDAFLTTYKAIIYEILQNRDRLYSNKLDALIRAVNNIDDHNTDKWLTNPFTEVPAQNIEEHYSGDVVGRPRRTDAEGNELSYFPDYYIIPVDEATQFNVPEAYRGLEQLERSGAKFRRTTKETEVGGVTYPAGTYVIDLRQYSRNYIHSVLDEGYDASFFASTYAEITVSLPALRGFKSVPLWSKDFFADNSVPVSGVAKPPLLLSGASEYVTVKTGSTDVVRLVNRLLNAGKPVRVVTAYTPYGNIGDFIAKSADIEAVKDVNVNGEPDPIGKKITAVVKDFPEGEAGLAAVSKALTRPRIAAVGSPIAPQYPQGTNVTGLRFALPFLEFPEDSYSISTNLEPGNEGLDGKGVISGYNVIFNDNVNLAAGGLTVSLDGKIREGVAYVGTRTNGVASAANLTGFTLGARTSAPNTAEGVFRSDALPTSSLVAAYANAGISYFGTSGSGNVLFGSLPEGTKRLITIGRGADNFLGGWWRNAANLPGGYDYRLTEGRTTAVQGLAGPDKNVPVTLFGTDVFWRVNTQYYWPILAQAIFEGASGITDRARPYVSADAASRPWSGQSYGVSLTASASDAEGSAATVAKQFYKISASPREAAYTAADGGWKPITGGKAELPALTGEYYVHWYAENSDGATNQGSYGPYRLGPNLVIGRSADDPTKVSAGFSVRNEGAQAASYYYVLAVYDKLGRLIQCDASLVEAGAGETVSGSLSRPLEGGATAKAFLWDSRYAPLYPAAELSLGQDAAG
ncbi:MAG: hypothetical protein LBG71_00630 [Clostridiales Family XIII bacterium]|nr:hypothetical protein [Clostridiales Family XIII bacterium]